MKESNKADAFESASWRIRCLVKEKGIYILLTAPQIKPALLPYGVWIQETMFGHFRAEPRSWSHQDMDSYGWFTIVSALASPQ